ncbi:MAG: mitofilin family membrane protein [Rhodospirillales bacterium]|nr:mitofilin family membrane protein [Rhodospirillales bacterium]
MTDTADKPSLKDIAAEDVKKDASETPAATDSVAKASNASQPGVEAKSGGGLVWFVVVLVILGGGAVAGWSVIGPSVEPVIADMRALLGMTPRPTQARLPSDTPPAVAEMPTEMATETPAEITAETPAAPLPETSETPVAAPETEPETQAAAEPAVAESEITAEPTAQETAPDAAPAVAPDAELLAAVTALKDEVAALSARIQALEDGSRADPTAPAQALVLGVTQLRSRLTGDSPFAAELAALETIAAGDATVMAALHRLKPHAEVGVPSEAALTARFAKVAQAVMSARSTSEAGGWLGAVKEGLGGIVTVRRTNPAEITDQVERAVAVAEAALELGELGEAVQVLSEVQGAPGEAAAAWLGDAHARLDAEAALEDLHRHALTVLSAAGGG